MGDLELGKKKSCYHHFHFSAMVTKAEHTAIPNGRKEFNQIIMAG
jgi:hypothetical protein